MQLSTMQQNTFGDEALRHRPSAFHALFLTMLLFWCCTITTHAVLDTVDFGNSASETAHSLEADLCESFTGSLGQPARRLLPKSPVEVNGGDMTVTMTVDPVRRNYFSIKLWGGDDTDDDLGRLYLYVPIDGMDYQVGYRHEGDYLPLSVAASRPPLPGRFFYSTTMLPLWMTRGKTSLTLKIVSTGRLYGLGSGGPPSGNYQFNMTMNSRGIYRAYTHVDPMLDPSGEAQGAAPAATTRPAVSESSVLGSAGTYTNGLNNWVNHKLAAAVTTFTTTDVELLAKAYVTPETTAGYNNSAVLAKIVEALDGFCTDYHANPVTSLTTSNYGGSGGNEVWGGRFGTLGWAIHLTSTPLAPFLDATASYGAGGTRTRRAAWGDMLAASRDNGRFNRRTITNQTLIADSSIYKANRGLLALSDARAFTETAAQRYLREACGLAPWLGSDLPEGGSALRYGSNYWQVTPKGLTREWGFVGGYGEMQIYAATFYDWTGNTEFRDQAVKMIKARAPFRRPAIEVSGSSNYRCMERVGLISWRGVREADGDFTNDLNYGDAVSWSAGARVAGQTLAPHAIGYAKQMLADNQFLNNLVADSRYYSSLTFDSRMAFEVWKDNNALKNTPDSGIRLPMTDGQPDFVWSDETGGVIAIKRGMEKLWIAPFYQAKTGTGINGVARFHRSTPQFDQYGVFETTPRFKAGGYYIRPNFVDKPESNTYVPPDNPTNAYAGEMLPLGQAPGDAQDPAPFRGVVDAYAFRFGRYLIGMNASSTPFGLKVPQSVSSGLDLVSNTNLAAISGEITVPAGSSVVLELADAADPAPVPNAPLCLVASGNSTPAVTLTWTPSSGAETYTVKRSTTSGGPYTAIEEATDINETTFTDTDVTGGAAYHYVVTASNANGESYASTEATASAGLASPWSAVDVGAVAIGGSSSYLDQRFTLTGTGSDVGGTADSFHFASLPVTGDGAIIARLSSRLLGGTSDDKVGLMVRDGTATGAVNFSLFIDAFVRNGFANRGRVTYRSSTDASTILGGEGSVLTIPEWFKVERAGSSFSGYTSDDGATWTLVASATLKNMPSSARFGLFVCSRDSVAVNTSAFDGVTAPGWAVTPQAPTGLNSQAGDERIGLSWLAVPGAASYHIKRSLVSGGPWQTVATGVTGTTYTNTPLANGTTYYHVVSAVNAAGESPDSQETAATPLPQPPDPPAGLNANAGNQFVALSWDASFGASGYKVKRAEASGGPYAVVAENVTAIHWTDSTVINGKTYHYVVTAFSSKGESGASMQVSATPSAIPEPPASLSANPGNGCVSLFWPASHGATSYSVKRAIASGGPYTVLASGVTTTTWLDSGATNGSEWFYVVTASNATGESASSPTASALPDTTKLPPPWSKQDIGGPTLAGGAAYNAGTFTAAASGADIGGTSDQFHFIHQPTAGNCTIIVRITSLQNVNTLAKAGIMIRQSLDANAKNAFLCVTPTTTNGIRFQNRTSAGGATATSHTRTGTSSSIPRWLRLVRSGDTFTASRSSNGTSWTTMGSATVSMTGTVYVGLALASHNNAQTTSATFSNLTLTLATPAVPAGLAVTTANSQTVLAWNASSDATSYSVKRSSTSGGPYTAIASGITAASFADATVTAGNTYFYVVSASNATGESGNSAEAGAMPTISPPPAPAGLTASPGDSSIALVWTSIPGAAYYKLKRAAANGPFLIIASPSSPDFTDTGLTNGAEFSYQVSAVNSAGEGADSAVVSATPQLPAPGVPANVRAASGDGLIVLTWAKTAHADSYRVKRGDSPAGPFTEIATPTANFLSDTGLANGTSYSYVVCAINETGESADSSVATATPGASGDGTWAIPAATAKPDVTTSTGNPNLTLSTNPFVVGDLAQVATAFSGFTASRYYWVVFSSGNTIQLSSSKGGAAITPTSAGTSAAALRSSQLWNMDSNWVGSVVARGVDDTATFPLQSPAPDVAAVLLDADTTLGRLNYRNGSNVADFTLASGPDRTLHFAVSGNLIDLPVPMIEIPQASNRRLNLGERDNAVLRIAGNQGLLIRSSAGGTVTDGIGSNPSKEVAVFNTDWTSFTGGITVDRGGVSLPSANRLPQQDLTLGTDFSLTSNVLAGISMGGAQTIDALRGNASGRIAGSHTLTLGANGGSGSFAGIIGRQFNGIKETTHLIKSGGGRQDLTGCLTGNGSLTVLGGSLALGGSGGHDISGSITATAGSLLVNGNLSPAAPWTPVTLAGTAGSTIFTSSAALKEGDQLRITTANAGLTSAALLHVVNTPTASTSVRVSTSPGGTPISATTTATATSQWLSNSNGTSGIVAIQPVANLGGSGTLRPFDTTTSGTAITVSGRLAPGDPLVNSGIGTLTFDGSNSLRPLASLESGGAMEFDLSHQASDRIELIHSQNGDLAFHQNLIHFRDHGTGTLPGGEHVLISADSPGVFTGLAVNGDGAITSGLAIGGGLENYPTKFLKLNGNSIVLVLENPQPIHASVEISNLNQAYTGTPRPVTVTTDPPGLELSVSYAGMPEAPSAPGPYQVTAVITEPGYTGQSVATLVIRQPLAEEEIRALRLAGIHPPLLRMEMTVPHHIYQLQRGTTLAADSWKNVGPATTGDGTPLQFADPSPPEGGRCFYRILITP